jgi:hypothetical protein
MTKRVSLRILIALAQPRAWHPPTNNTGGGHQEQAQSD